MQGGCHELCRHRLHDLRQRDPLCRVLPHWSCNIFFSYSCSCLVTVFRQLSLSFAAVYMSCSFLLHSGLLRTITNISCCVCGRFQAAKQLNASLTSDWAILSVKAYRPAPTPGKETKFYHGR